MDLVKIWGNMLAAGVGVAPVCTIPTMYFVQGVQVLAYANDAFALGDDAGQAAPTAAAASSFLDEELEDDTSNGSEAELGCDDDDDDDDDNEGSCETQRTIIDRGVEAAATATPESFGGEGDADGGKQGTRRRRIQRIRYSREEYRCVMCPYTCTTEKAFLRHLRSCEIERKPQAQPALSCPICGKDRIGEQSILVHMQKHRAGKHFCCDLCKFKTLQLKKLIQHRRMHTGEKPHLCPFCTYRSARRDNLRSHVRRVHKKDNLTCDTFTPRSMLLIPTKLQKYDS